MHWLSENLRILSVVYITTCCVLIFDAFRFRTLDYTKFSTLDWSSKSDTSFGPVDPDNEGCMIFRNVGINLPSARRNIAEYFDCINNDTHRYEGLRQSVDFHDFGLVLIAVWRCHCSDNSTHLVLPGIVRDYTTLIIAFGSALNFCPTSLFTSRQIDSFGTRYATCALYLIGKTVGRCNPFRSCAGVYTCNAL